MPRWRKNLVSVPQSGQRSPDLVSQGQLGEAGDAGPALGGEENAQGDSEATGTSVQVTINTAGQTKRSSFSPPQSQEAYSQV